MRLFDVFDRAVAQLSRGLNYFVSVALLAMVFLTTADVSGRYLFSHPIRGTVELCEVALVILTFCGIAYAWRSGAHISVELVFNRLPRKLRPWLNMMTCVFTLFIVILLSRQALVFAFDMAQRGQKTALLGVPIFYFYLSIFIGCAVLSLEVLAETIRSGIEIHRGKEKGQ